MMMDVRYIFFSMTGSHVDLFPDIPLSYLMKKSHAFLQAASTPSLAGLPEIAYVKAIRTHVSDLMEVRLILTNEGPSSFGPNRWSSKKLPTGYEVKRKPTKNRFQGYGKTDWDDLTIYVVCFFPVLSPLNLTFVLLGEYPFCVSKHLWSF